MATINEEIVTGRKFRKLIDEATKLWQRISFWTKSSDVEFDDGKDAETKVGAIDGITDSLVSTSSNIAASAKALSQVNNNLKGFEPILDGTGKITGYKTSVGGADTVFPFSGNYTVVFRLTITAYGYMNADSHGSKSWDITAKISNGKCTFSPSSVAMTSSLLTKAVGSGNQYRIYIPWTITLISITAD